MGTDKNSTFPNADAWAANLPHARADFAAAFPKKPVAAPTVSAEDEYRRFAQLDLSNLGR